MAEDAGRFSWIGEGIKSVAGIAVFGLIGLGAAKLGLAPAKELTDAQNWPLWLALVLLYATYEIAWRPLHRAYLRWRVRKASGNGLAVLIARFDGNTDGGSSLRETVREAIKKEFADAVEILLWPEALRLAEGHDTDAEAEILRKGQAWLKSKSCDVLIWGRVKSSEVLALRFTVAEAKGTAPESYKLTESLELPVAFVSKLGAAIAAWFVASAAPAVDMDGQYLVPLMRKAAERLQPIVSQMNPAFDADTRGAILHNYGLIRSTIGEQTGSNVDLEAAVAAYRAALKEWTRERVPLKWAGAQNSLGNTLRDLGRRESGTARLEEAVVALRAALSEASRERVPPKWATTQNNLGIALQALGERESGTARLEEAIVAYRAALEEWTRERVPFNWAMTQNNLGTALQRLGERESGTARLEEAVATFRAALEELPRERVPLKWAATQNNLGNALTLLGAREGGAAQLEGAIAAFRAALEERARERAPLPWAIAQTNLANALLTLFDQTGEWSSVDAALVAVDSALEEYRKAGAENFVENAGRLRADILQRTRGR